jgi:hypothetical protein
VLQSSPDLLVWQSIATNWLSSARWRHFDNFSTGQGRFYRATVE